MRKTMTHLKDVSRLISTHEQNSGTCQRRNFHLQTLLQMFQPSKKELFTMSHHCIPYRRRSMLITKLYRAVSNYSVDYASEARKSTSSAMRLPRSLTMLNLTNHLSLSELDYAIRTQQADKAWSIFVNLSKQGDTIPLTICCSLYALLVYARSMLSRGRIVENRQYQMNQLLDPSQRDCEINSI